MFGGLAFLKYGRMCCGVVGDDLMVRMLDVGMPAALAHRYVRPMDFTGRAMRGFVHVAAPAVRTVPQVRRWVAAGVRYVAQTPPARRRRPSRSRP
jgi:hypothetical protein